MQKKRLLKLAALLEADAKNKKGVKFDLRTWGEAYEDDEPVSVSCGTTACAMGLAVVSGAFKRAGLGNAYSPGHGRILPKFDGETGFAAAAQLFGVSSDQSEFLFSMDRYPPQKIKGAVAERYVAKRIRDFVAGKVAA